MGRVAFQTIYQAAAGTLSDGDTSPLRADADGRLLVNSGAVSVEPTQLSSADVGGGFLTLIPGPIRLYSAVCANKNIWADGVDLYLLLFDATPPGPFLPGTPDLALGPYIGQSIGRDVLGSSGWLFTSGCAYAWSVQPNALVPPGGDPLTYLVHAAFQFTAV